MRKFVTAILGATSLCSGVAVAEDGAVEISLAYTADVAGAFEGAISQRGRFLDNLDLVVDLDMERATGWRGVTAHIDVLNNSGDAPNDVVGTLQGVDNIEVASQRLRLFEVWVEQAWGSSSLRVGLYDLNMSVVG
jgi:porin